MFNRLSVIILLLIRVGFCYSSGPAKKHHLAQNQAISNLIENSLAVSTNHVATNFIGRGPWAAVQQPNYESFINRKDIPLNQEAQKTLWLDAITDSNLFMLSKLILTLKQEGAGFLLDATLEDGKTALHIAAQKGDYISLEFLLQYACAQDKAYLINQEDKDNNTPMDLVLEAGSFPLLKLLHEYKAQYSPHNDPTRKQWLEYAKKYKNLFTPKTIQILQDLKQKDTIVAQPNRSASQQNKNLLLPLRCALL